MMLGLQQSNRNEVSDLKKDEAAQPLIKKILGLTPGVHRKSPAFPSASSGAHALSNSPRPYPPQGSLSLSKEAAEVANMSKVALSSPVILGRECTILKASKPVPLDTNLTGRLGSP